LYILIIVLVLVVGIFVLRPILAKKSAAPAKSATAARPAAKGKAAAATDTGGVTAKAAAGKQKVKAAKGKAAAKAGAAPAAQAAKSEAAQPEAAVSKDTTPLVWQSDPFVRDWMLAGELRDMKVRAVTLGARPLALINDRIVSLNDTISGKRVAAITRDSVVFEFGGQRRSLKIGE
jgi:nucleoid-associated protein YgaU